MRNPPLRRLFSEVGLSPLRRGKNAHGLPVLGHRTTRDIDRIVRQKRGDVLVAVGFSRVFGGDNAADFLLYTFARDVVPVTALETALDKAPAVCARICSPWLDSPWIHACVYLQRHPEAPWVLAGSLRGREIPVEI